jgi:hypothetical protein
VLVAQHQEAVEQDRARAPAAFDPIMFKLLTYFAEADHGDICQIGRGGDGQHDGHGSSLRKMQASSLEATAEDENGRIQL